MLGYSQSGKTTTIECIIKELHRRNYSVGTIKEIHFDGFTMDEEGTNTFRHKKAGAELVTARSHNETNILFPGRLPVEKILMFYEHDFVIMEGVSDYDAPRILCARSEEEIEAKIDTAVIAISGVVSNKLTNYKSLPVYNPIKDIEGLVDYIEEKIVSAGQYSA